MSRDAEKALSNEMKSYGCIPQPAGIHHSEFRASLTAEYTTRSQWLTDFSLINL